MVVFEGGVVRRPKTKQTKQNAVRVNFYHPMAVASHATEHACK